MSRKHLDDYQIGHSGITPTPKLPRGGRRPQGLLNSKVMRSLSPMARYGSRSVTPSLRVGGRHHTPAGWSALSLGLALISLRATSTKPAASARAITDASVI